MDIRCLLRGESTRCRKGQQPIPFLYSCSGGNSPGYDAIEQPLRCARRGRSVLEPGVTQHHLGCWRLRIYLKPLEAIKVYFVNAVTVGLAQCPEQDEALGSRELIHPMQCSLGCCGGGGHTLCVACVAAAHFWDGRSVVEGAAGYLFL